MKPKFEYSLDVPMSRLSSVTASAAYSASAS